MKRLHIGIMLIALTIVLGVVSADNTVTFYFYDINSSTLNNVTVDYGTGSTTLNSGDSLILPTGNYTFTFSKEGYKNSTLTTELIGNTTITVYFEPTNTTTNVTKLTSLPQPSVPQELQGYAPNITSLNTDISELFTGPTGWALAVILILGLAIASLKFHQKPAVTAAVIGTSIIYIGTWVNANWSILWVLIAMLFSASVLKTFGRYQK